MPAQKRAVVRRSAPNGPRHVAGDRVHGLTGGVRYPLNVSTIGEDEDQHGSETAQWAAPSHRPSSMGMKGSRVISPRPSSSRRASDVGHQDEFGDPPERRRIQSARARDTNRNIGPTHLEGEPREVIVKPTWSEVNNSYAGLQMRDLEHTKLVEQDAGSLENQPHPMVRVPALVLTPRFPTVSVDGGKTFQPESRRPLSARVAAAAYVHRDKRIENIMSKEIAPRPNADTWTKVKCARHSVKDEDARRNESSRYQFPSANRDIAIGKRPELPQDLQNLSIIAKQDEIRRRLAAEARPQTDAVIGVRKPGYNPLLRKYDQPMPLKDAKYLALGHSEDVIAVHAYSTPRTPRPPSARSSSTASKEKPEELSRKLVPNASARIDELAKPVEKMKGRNEPRKDTAVWFLRDGLRPKVVYKDHIENNTTNLDRFRPENQLAELAEKSRRHKELVLAKNQLAAQRAEERRAKILEKLQTAHERSGATSAREKSNDKAKWREDNLRMGWLRVIFAVKYIRNAQYIMEMNRDPFAEAEGKSATFYASVFAQNVVTQIQNKQIMSFISENNLREKMHVLSAIRWVFDQRKTLWEGEKVSAPIVRFLLRYHTRKQRRKFDRAADMIVETLKQTGKTQGVLQAIREYRQQVVSCQRFFRRCIIRSRKRAGQITRRWDELQAVLVLRDMQAAVQAHLNSIGERMSFFTITGTRDLQKMRVSEEKRWSFERIFPGLPLWVGAVLDKISSELIRVLSQHYSLGAKPSDVWSLMLRIYTQSRMPRHINANLCRDIRAEFNKKSQLMWHDYLLQRKTRRLKEEQDLFIVQALGSWGEDARELFEREKKGRKVAVIIRKPEWPIADLNEHFALECYKQGMSILATELGEQPPSTQERVFTEINALLSHTQDSTFEIGAAIEAKSNAPTIPPAGPRVRPNKPPSSINFNLKPQPSTSETSSLRRSGVMFADDVEQHTSSNTSANLRRSGDLSSTIGSNSSLTRSGDFGSANRRSGIINATRKSGFFQPIPG